MFKRLGINSYICDTEEDLSLLPEKELGADAYVIKPGASYRLMSTGEWVRQGGQSAEAGEEVDLTNYATKDYVDSRLEIIDIPDVSEFITEAALVNLSTKDEVEEVASNPVLKAFDFTRNPTREDGQSIYLTVDDPTTLQEALQEKGIGLYNVWVQKGRADLPQSMIDNSTSGRGFACVDLQTAADPAAFIGYVILFDKMNNMYYRFFNKGTAGSWMKVAATED